MDTERELQIEPHSGAARAARRFVEQTLSDWGLAGRAKEVLLVCHELVANALVHARSTARLRLRRIPGRLVVEVADADSRLPRRLSVDNLNSMSGRGMVIVEGLARAWGARPVAQGKVVWAEFVTDGRTAERLAADRTGSPVREPVVRASLAAGGANEGFAPAAG